MSSDLHPLTLSENGELSKTDEQPLVPAQTDGPWITVLRWFDSWAGIEKMQTDTAPRRSTGCGPSRSSSCICSAWACSLSGGAGLP